MKLFKGAIFNHVRHLHLHEYQSKQLMQKYGLFVQRFKIINKHEDLNDIEKYDEYVIKAQIHAGGRGKGVFNNGFRGGVQLTKDLEKIPGIVKNMLGYNLITNQTPNDGVKVKQVMIAESFPISRETYLAIVLDPTSKGPVIIGSKIGGMDIEALAIENPEAIFSIPINIQEGVSKEQAEQIAIDLGFTSDSLKAKATDQILKLYDLFIAVDATQIEINPFGESTNGEVICFDAKVNFDDNSAFRQKDIFNLDDGTEQDPKEIEAKNCGLNYVSLDGNIGCLVNGAGLAMATMDIIKLHGQSPANFLDVGGSATQEQVQNAFKIITSDQNVKAILVNIFGGIMKCDVIAGTNGLFNLNNIQGGIVAAAKEMDMKVPLIVRLSGTNVELGKKILDDSGLNIVFADDLETAAQKVTAAIN